MKYQNLDLKFKPSINVWILDFPNLLNFQSEWAKMMKIKIVKTPVITMPEIKIPLPKFHHLSISWVLISIKQVKNKLKKFSKMYRTVKLKKTNLESP